MQLKTKKLVVGVPDPPAELTNTISAKFGTGGIFIITITLCGISS
jgi:hypothetical protein